MTALSSKGAESASQKCTIVAGQKLQKSGLCDDAGAAALSGSGSRLRPEFRRGGEAQMSEILKCIY